MYIGFYSYVIILIIEYLFVLFAILWIYILNLKDFQADSKKTESLFFE